MTALGSVPKAQTQGDPEGTWNLEKLHLELKYLGRKLAEARLQREEHNQLKPPAQTTRAQQPFLIEDALKTRRKWPRLESNRVYNVCVLCRVWLFPMWLCSRAGTHLDCLFLLGSSAANTCTVPWSLDTQMRDASWLKLMLVEGGGDRERQRDREGLGVRSKLSLVLNWGRESERCVCVCVVSLLTSRCSLPESLVLAPGSADLPRCRIS